MGIAGMVSSNTETVPIVEPVVQVWIITEIKTLSLTHFGKKQNGPNKKNER